MARKKNDPPAPDPDDGAEPWRRPSVQRAHERNVVTYLSGRTIAQLEKDREREQAFNAWMESRRAERAAAARYWALADPKLSAP